MQLITKEIQKAFEKQGYTGNSKPENIKIICKLFNPSGGGTWYLYEKETEDIYRGFVTLGDSRMAECGTISLDELKSFRGPLGLGIERDTSFTPGEKTLTQVQEIIKEGGHI